MQAPAQTLTLKFRDAALEAEYQRAAARATIGSHRLLWGIALLVWCLASLWDSEMGVTAANARWITTVRIAGLPLLVIVAAAGWLKVETFTRWRNAISAFGVATVLGTQVLMAALMPNGHVVTSASVPMSITVTVFAMCAWSAALGLDLRIPFIGVALHGLGYLALRPFYPEAQPPPIIFWYSSAVLLGWVVAFIVERARRTAFLATREANQLLENVLPASIAERLKATPGRIADHFENATILFGDIVGFTPLSQQLSPTELVAALDQLFSKFDDLAQAHGLEKIKTIGDAYMVVGGVPIPRPDHAEAVAAMALAMRDLVRDWRFGDGRTLQMRIGIHTGSVVAGVIGKKKFIYDLWGDAVNTASRMESHGVEGHVQVTEATRALLEGRFELEPRGTVHVKGKGEMQTWLLKGRIGR